jgi:glutamate--cysteine ligase
VIDGDPGAEWATYALDARVMFVRGEGTYRLLDEPLTFREWIVQGNTNGFPDADDLVYHLTTLFPPIRPRGYLEIRALDMLPDPWWRVAVAVTAALVCDPRARRRAVEACATTSDAWVLAARCGLEDPQLFAAARECFAAARDALESVGCDATTAAALDEYVERFVSVGRSPAHDQLDRYTAPTMEAI